MLTGGCLCGAVRYEAQGEPLFAGHCHCRDCQKASGAGHASVIGMPRSGLRISGETAGFAVTGGSGRPATRHFCPTCGGQLYGSSEMAPEIVTIYAGSLDDPSQFRPQLAINVRSRQPWDHVKGDLPEFDGMPPMT